jgi:VanZ family protein
MNILFSILSIVYIAGIFLFADSPMVSTMATFNPYSLLHIPLYGILTFLLLLSIAPYKPKITNPMNPTNSMNSINPINYLIAGLVALGVAIADEIHQAYLPARNASMIDVFLDVIGVGLSILVFFRLGSTMMGFSQRKL